jgi:hypothetical protein
MAQGLVGLDQESAIIASMTTMPWLSTLEAKTKTSDRRYSSFILDLATKPRKRTRSSAAFASLSDRGFEAVLLRDLLS